MKYKNTASKIVVMALVLTSSVPYFAFAQSTSSTTPTGFCLTIDAFEKKTNGNILEQVAKFESRRAEKLEGYSEKRLKRDQNFKSSRAENDEEAYARYEKLSAKATSTAQKAAVTAFQKTHTNAKEVRRVAIDRAIGAYRIAVSDILTKRSEAVEKLLLAFRADVVVALNKAKSDCASGVDSKVVREQLQTSLKASKEKLQDDRSALEKTSASIDGFIEIRKTAFKKALDQYKADMEKAKIALMTAFRK